MTDSSCWRGQRSQSPHTSGYCRGSESVIRDTVLFILFLNCTVPWEWFAMESALLIIITIIIRAVTIIFIFTIFMVRFNFN